MKKKKSNPFVKILLIAIAAIGGLIGAFIALTLFRYERTFDAPYPDIKAVTDAEVVERGKYLVFGPAHCADCHAAPEERAKVDAGQEADLSGGHIIDTFLGEIIASNITSDATTGIGEMSDGEIARFFRTNIDHRDQVGLPMMMYPDLSNEDLTAIISYLRATKPVNHVVLASQYNLLGKITKAFFLDPFAPSINPPPTPTRGVTAAYGEYLVNKVANCGACHTERNMKTGEYTGAPLAGGMIFRNKLAPGETVISPNLTPDPKTGPIAAWSQDLFIQRFQLGKLPAWSPMPWGSFSRMTPEDLGAIYLYLQQLPPVHKENNLPKEG